MGTVTQYNLANVQAALGGANPISMSEYYRGGAYVPTSRTTTVREPASGSTYINGGFFAANNHYWVYASDGSYLGIAFNSRDPIYNGTGFASTVTSGGYTYYRDTFQTMGSNIYTGVTYYYHAVYRTSTGTSSINTGVPSSGAISISQLYGAANP
jgi:hypothetical protein